MRGEFRGLNSLFSENFQKYLSISLQLRARFEYQENFDFNSSIDDEDGFYLLRTRANIKVKPSEYFEGFLQIQDSRVLESSFSDSPARRNDLDLRQFYGEIKPAGRDVITIRFGRQELKYGDERLIGAFDWSNVAQSFDVVKFTLNLSSAKFDLFASKHVKVRMKSLDRWEPTDNLLGAYFTFLKIPLHELNLYYFFRDTKYNVSFGDSVGNGQLDESTAGFLMKGKELKGFEYILEGAYQFGNFGNFSINAFAFVIFAGYTLPFAGKVKIAGEWDVASGDTDPEDNKRGTFDNLFPTNHLFYGYMDRASLQNLNNMRLHISSKPSDKLYLQADVHILRLFTSKDSLYDAGRKVLRNSLPGANPYVGTELDLLLKYSFNQFVDVLLGYSHFFPGDFLEKTGPSDDGKFFYLQTNLTL